MLACLGAVTELYCFVPIMPYNRRGVGRSEATRKHPVKIKRAEESCISNPKICWRDVVFFLDS
jgi:hypothetical protein